MSKNYDWFVGADLSKQAGKWVVIVDQKIVASGYSIKSLLAKAEKKYPGMETVLAKVPEKGITII